LSAVTADAEHSPQVVDWSSVRRVLLMRLRSIGDTVLMTPCLSAIKSWRPDIAITVLSEPLAAPLLEDHPSVDDLIIAERGLSTRARTINTLRRDRFDVAFNLHGGSTATFMARLSGANETVGYKAYPYSWLLSKRAPSPAMILGRNQIHSVEQQLALLHWAGVPWPNRPGLNLHVSPDADSSLRDRLASLFQAKMPLQTSAQSGPEFCVIAPAAASESKRWSVEGFADVADHLNDFWKLPSVVTAAEGEEELARAVCETAQSNPKYLTGLTLKQSVALFARAKLFVGNDSGPAHVAAAFGRPMVVVFGSSNPLVWRPWMEAPYRIMQPPERRRSTLQVSDSDVLQPAVSGQATISGDQIQQPRGPSSPPEAADSIATRPTLGPHPISQIQVHRVISAVDEVMEAALEAGFAQQQV
jgi:lipopolysaccharide heptosyltransferase III